MADLEMYWEIVEAVAQALEATSYETAGIWATSNSVIPRARSFVGPGGNDRLAAAFYSGYTRRERDLSYQGRSLPLRFGNRADTGHESARLIRAAEDAASAGMPH